MELIYKMLDLKDEIIASLREQISILEKENSELRDKLSFEERKSLRDNGKNG